MELNALKSKGSEGSEGSEGFEGSEGPEGSECVEGSEGFKGSEGSEGSGSFEGSEGFDLTRKDSLKRFKLQCSFLVKHLYEQKNKHCGIKLLAKKIKIIEPYTSPHIIKGFAFREE